MTKVRSEPSVDRNRLEARVRGSVCGHRRPPARATEGEHGLGQQESNGETRLAYILGVPLAEEVIRQWPQMQEVVRTSQLVGDVEGNFPELTLEVGRRLQLDDGVVVEWTCDTATGASTET